MTCSWIDDRCREPDRYVVSWNTFHIIVCTKHVDPAIRWALGLHPQRPPSLADAVTVTLVEKWRDTAR